MLPGSVAPTSLSLVFVRVRPSAWRWRLGRRWRDLRPPFPTARNPCCCMVYSPFLVIPRLFFGSDFYRVHTSFVAAAAQSPRVHGREESGLRSPLPREERRGRIHPTFILSPAPPLPEICWKLSLRLENFEGSSRNACLPHLAGGRNRRRRRDRAVERKRSPVPPAPRNNQPMRWYLLLKYNSGSPSPVFTATASARRMV